MFSLLDPGLGVGHVEMRKTVSPAEVFWISEGRQVRKQRLPLGCGKDSDRSGDRILWEFRVGPFSLVIFWSPLLLFLTDGWGSQIVIPALRDGLNTRRKSVANVHEPEVQLKALLHWMKEKEVSRAGGHRVTGARPCLKNEGFRRPGERLVEPRAALGKGGLDTSHGWLLLPLTLALLFSPFPRHLPCFSNGCFTSSYFFSSPFLLSPPRVLRLLTAPILPFSFPSATFSSFLHLCLLAS